MVRSWVRVPWSSKWQLDQYSCTGKFTWTEEPGGLPWGFKESATEGKKKKKILIQ